MIALRLTYMGGGRFQTRTRTDFDAAGATFEQGAPVIAKIGQRRSVRQNNLFHALIEAAWSSQRGGPRFDHWSGLKKWLLIRAGHCDETRIDLNGMAPAVARTVAAGVASALRQSEGGSTVTTSYDTARHQLVLRSARSVRFDKTTAETMNPVVDRIVDIICTEIVPGVAHAEILEQARRMAA